MKKGILFLFVVSIVAVKAEAQSLKDLLYSGKLKMDSNTVVRKTDDLSQKIDTATKKPAETAPVKVAATPSDSSIQNTASLADSGVAAVASDSLSAEAVTEDSIAVAETPAKGTTAPAKSNTRILKEYTDSLAAVLKTEVLSNRRIKKDTYYLIVEYELDANGQATVSNVISTPENALLQEQVKERMLITPPQLAPALDSNGQPRKVKRKYSFTVTKE